MGQPSNLQYQPSLTLIKGEARKVEANWGQYCRQKSVTLSSSSWSTTPTSVNCITTSDATISGNIATITATATQSTDSCYLDNKATMSNGEILIKRFPIYTE